MESKATQAYKANGGIRIEGLQSSVNLKRVLALAVSIF